MIETFLALKNAPDYHLGPVWQSTAVEKISQKNRQAAKKNYLNNVVVVVAAVVGVGVAVVVVVVVVAVLAERTSCDDLTTSS